MVAVIVWLPPVIVVVWLIEIVAEPDSKQKYRRQVGHQSFIIIISNIQLNVTVYAITGSGS